MSIKRIHALLFAWAPVTLCATIFLCHVAAQQPHDHTQAPAQTKSQDTSNQAVQPVQPALTLEDLG